MAGRYDGARGTATHLLQHYFQLTAQASGVKWTGDNDAEVASIVDAILKAVRDMLREEDARRRDLEALDLEEYAQADTQETGADGRPIEIVATQDVWEDMTDSFPDGRENICAKCGAELQVDTDGVSVVCPVHGSEWLPPEIAHAIGLGAPATQDTAPSQALQYKALRNTAQRAGLDVNNSETAGVLRVLSTPAGMTVLTALVADGRQAQRRTVKVNVPVMPILSIISAIDVACGGDNWDSLSAELRDAVAWAGSLLTNDSRVFGVTRGRMARGDIAKLLERVRTAEMIENGQDLSGEMYSTEGSVYTGTLDVTQ